MEVLVFKQQNNPCRSKVAMQQDNPYGSKVAKQQDNTYGSKVAKQQGNSYVSKVAKQQGNPYRTMVSKQQNNPYGYVDGCYFHFEGQDFQLKKLNSFARAGNVVNACAVLRIQVPPLIAKLCNFCPSYD